MRLAARGLAVMLACAAVATALGWSAGAPATGTTELRVTMDDGVELAGTLYLPDGGAPAGGWPGVVALHGVGATRAQIAPIAQALQAAGFAVYAYDARAHGQSGGLFSAAGPRELADLRAVREWLAARSEVSDTIGAFGISYGGGQVLRALTEGAPLRAAVVAETWVDLYSSFVSGGLTKSGAVFGFLNSVPADRRAPEINAIAGDALGSRNLPALRDFAARRSSLAGLRGVQAPVLFLQGRRDFVFGIDQGLTAYRALPARDLYIGPFGHSPSRFPGPDIDAVVRRTVDWFRRTLGGVGQAPPRNTYALAPDPYRAAGERRFARAETRVARFAAGGTSRIGGAGSFTRNLGRTKTLLETFGAPVVRVRASGTFPHVVAVLKARTPSGTEIVVSEGGTRTSLGSRPRAIAIRLTSQATTIPRGSRLTLRIGSTSGDLLYISPAPTASRLIAGRATLSLPVLRRPVSR